MSKAFTREDDDAPIAPVTRRKVDLPDGVPNYITAGGAKILRAELAITTDPVRAQELAEHLGSAQLVEPAAADRVRFGSTVELSNGARYQIVGAIEADPKAGKISWQSPLARKLLGAQVGDEIGELEVVAIGDA